MTAHKDHVLSMRVDDDMKAKVDALVEVTQRSRTKVLDAVVTMGIEDEMEALDSATRIKVRSAYRKLTGKDWS
jgi:predicted transcriptional regulator